MPTPNSLQDALGLNGKLTALSRFISKSVDKAMPLFHNLKGCIEKNNFQWMNEAEKALQKIKEALHELPTLATPILRETLQLYHSTSGELISSAHQIEVLTSYPIKQILLRPETSGRLAKWEIKLGENDINYRPRTSIKGQALSDFLLEIPDGGNPAKERVWVVKEAPADHGSWTLYTDGASGREGSGAGMILTSPEGEEVTYALRFDFHTSNNEAEYEALLAGLRLAKQMVAKAVTALTDSRLAANQVNGSFEVRDQRMGKYVKMVKQLIGSFGRFTIKQIPRSENKRANALSKLASTCFNHLSKNVLVEVLRERSIDEQQVNILTPAGPTWMTPLWEYLQRGVLPDDHDEARKIRIKAPSYAMVNGELYKKGFTSPWLKCVDQAKGGEILQEAHSGQVGAHEGAKALTGKVLRMGVYWPTIQQDAIEVTRKCGECQSYAPVQANPSDPLSNISSPWPFYQWGIDIEGPFLEAPRKLKYMVVAVDYFTKWIEAEPLACISGRHMIKFVWKNIMTRFGTHKVLISDNGLQFAENPFREWCTAKGISQRFTPVAHPQANGQTEVSNRTIVNGIKKRLGKEKGNWAEEIPMVLWSYKTTPRKSTKETPFSLTYETEAMLRMEVAVNTLRVANKDEESNIKDLRINLDILEEKREESGVRQAAYKHATERYYNQRVKEKAFKVGEYVLRKNEASRAQPQGKLGPTWEGPSESQRQIGTVHTC
ncbi:uncharacterized protein LOC111894856 [Lactuca sativa]|uniref:uncharacterized protein LOC111894856 n=1 Tax=Lactuca sativa TaxID=4236 RepID=UPI000CD81498|nr:uncharacterized protein LOC111894856 [Lactuca sativa]